MRSKTRRATLFAPLCTGVEQHNALSLSRPLRVRLPVAAICRQCRLPAAPLPAHRILATCDSGTALLSLLRQRGRIRGSHHWYSWGFVALAFLPVRGVGLLAFLRSSRATAVLAHATAVLICCKTIHLLRADEIDQIVGLAGRLLPVVSRPCTIMRGLPKSRPRIFRLGRELTGRNTDGSPAEYSAALRQRGDDTRFPTDPS